MSGTSDCCPCPNCGAQATIYTDWKPFEYTTITCLECGLSIYPLLSYMDLNTLNEERDMQELEPLKELPEQDPNIW